MSTCSVYRNAFGVPLGNECHVDVFDSVCRNAFTAFL
jgi:hypothetical protein